MITAKEMHDIIVKTGLSQKDFSLKVFKDEKIAGQVKLTARRRGFITLLNARRIVRSFTSESIEILGETRTKMIVSKAPKYKALKLLSSSVTLDTTNFSGPEFRRLRSLRSTISNNLEKEASLEKLVDFAYFYHEILRGRKGFESINEIVELYVSIDTTNDSDIVFLRKDGKKPYRATPKKKRKPSKKERDSYKIFNKDEFALRREKRTRVIKTKVPQLVFNKLSELAQSKGGSIEDLAFDILLNELRSPRKTD